MGLVANDGCGAVLQGPAHGPCDHDGRELGALGGMWRSMDMVMAYTYNGLVIIIEDLVFTTSYK